MTDSLHDEATTKYKPEDLERPAYWAESASHIDFMIEHLILKAKCPFPELEKREYPTPLEVAIKWRRDALIELTDEDPDHPEVRATNLILAGLSELSSAASKEFYADKSGENRAQSAGDMQAP